MRTRREKLDMTQQHLADAAEVSLKTVSNLENEGTTPQRRTLDKIREALGLSSDIVVARAQAEDPSGVGFTPAYPPQVRYQEPRRAPERTRLRGLVSHMSLEELAARVVALEDRVAALEMSDDSPTVSLAADDYADKIREQEESD